MPRTDWARKALLAGRCRYYRQKIDEGSYYLGFKPATISLPYDMGVFLKSLEPAFLAQVAGNAVSGKDLYAGMTGFLERPYLSETDGELDSFLIYVPTTYDPAKPAPVLIFLHGNGGGSYQSPVMPSYHTFLEACEARGVILVAPQRQKPRRRRELSVRRRRRKGRPSGTGTDPKGVQRERPRFP